MAKDKLIYKARVANKLVRVWHRFFNNRDEYSVSITGGKWNMGTLFGPDLASKMEYARTEIKQRHPRAPWRVELDARSQHGIATVTSTI